MPRFPVLYQLIVLSLLVKQALCLSVSIPVAAPSTAPTIAPDLVSLSIESDLWTDWTGTTSRNQFFFNTLQNLINLTGKPPRFRLGGHSEDNTNFSPNVQFFQASFPGFSTSTPYPEASNIVAGDGYYQAAQFLPPNTRITWGMNLKENNLTAVFLETRSLMKAFASSAMKNAGVILDSIEVGNEADGFGLSLPTYIQQWEKIAQNITATAGLTKSSSTKLWGAAFAGSSHSTSGFSPQSIIAQNILSSAAGSLITTMSGHRYSGSFCTGSGGLLQNLMDKASIRGNLTSFNPDIAATKAKGLDYVMGETNSYACHGAPGVSNTAGAALWTLDYALFGPQIGISRLFFHQGVGYKYSMIQRVTLTRSPLDGSTLSSPLPPHIQPQYYAAIIAAEAIGNSGNTRAVEISINNSFISGYAFYVGNKLTKALFINSQAFLTTSSGARGSTQITFGLTGSGAPTRMTVKRLSIPHADATSGLTWGGQTFETSDGKVSGSVQVTTANVSDGFSIQETEAVLVTFQ
ncbi:hypothetical protein GALMADRAFT_209155 [Galerina marginata CBS 339.88]|uniref:Beta-glucuronidase C-terminal domain-containing protein n=1 Tax=Galerina marginata (strain CBS 339.88) TaxID=685588 RepID=A0A067T6J1_GALM3|nr:hypothetical protein GALMADRAFT_209155 [Galerina marginata CBS 339.88]